MSEHDVMIATGGVIVASIAVVITAIGIFLSNQKTQESNELLKKDIDSRMRPWLTISNILPNGIVFKDGSSDSWNAYQEGLRSGRIKKGNEKNVNFGYVIDNKGLLSTSISRIQFIKEDDISRDELNQQKKDDSVFNLVPQENFKSNLTMPYERFSTLDSKKFCIGINLEYNWDDGKKDTVGKILHIERGRSVLIDSW